MPTPAQRTARVPWTHDFRDEKVVHFSLRHVRRILFWNDPHFTIRAFLNHEWRCWLARSRADFLRVLTRTELRPCKRGGNLAASGTL